MNYPKIAMMLEDNQQKSKDAENMALRTEWKIVESWTDVENEIVRAWLSVDSTYSPILEQLSAAFVRMHSPKTLIVRIGIMVSKGRTFSRLNYSKQGRQDNIRTFYPNYDERYDLFELQGPIRKEIAEIKGIAGDVQIDETARKTLLAQFSMAEAVKTMDLPEGSLFRWAEAQRNENVR